MAPATPPGRSRSDVLVAVGALVIGAAAILVGVAASDAVTVAFGAVAVAAGLAFAVPLLRSRWSRGRR
jgi:uncharacterized membrane protein HdeD (DUF308 family)